MSAPVTALYAALLGFVFLALSNRVIRARRKARVAVGAGSDADLLRASRVHGNFAEYVPIGLILLLIAELGRVPVPAVHAIGIFLVVGRLVHAYGVSQTKENFRFRVTGMMLTFAALALAALANLAVAIGLVS